MTARRMAIGALLLSALLVATEPSPAAPKPKVVGRLSGLPGRTPAAVSAVDPNTLAVLAAARVKRKGRYKLPAQSRVTMLFGNLEGEAPLFAASRAFRPAGRRTRMDLQLAPTLAPAVSGGVRPLGAATPTAAVTVEWGITASIGGNQTRISHLVEADIVRSAARRCDLTTVTSDPERRRAVEDEVALQQAGGVDPSTAITFNPRPPTVRVQGGGTDSSGGHTLTLQAVEIGTGNVIAETSQTGVNAFGTIERASREMALRLCDLVGAPAGPGDPYLVAVEGTHSAQFVYRTPDSEDSSCNARDEADGTQMFSFESEPVRANVVTRNGISIVSIEPAAVLFTGTRNASYRFIRDGPACFPPTPFDTSGCGAPQDPLGVAEFAFTQSKIRTAIGFPDYIGCPFTPLIDANTATGEAPFDARKLDPGGPTVFTFQQRQDENEGNQSEGFINQGAAVTNWTVTFTPAD